MQFRAVLRHRRIHRQNAARERRHDAVSHPRPQHRTLYRVAALRQQHADLQLLYHDRRDIPVLGIHTVRPARDVRVGPPKPNLAEFRNDSGIQNEHRERSAARTGSPKRGSSNSISATPGIARRSAIVCRPPVILRYSSMLNSTCAGLPRSVINTVPSNAAFFARLVSRLNARLDRVVMVMAPPEGETQDV